MALFSYVAAGQRLSRARHWSHPQVPPQGDVETHRLVVVGWSRRRLYGPARGTALGLGAVKRSLAYAFGAAAGVPSFMAASVRVTR